MKGYVECLETVTCSFFSRHPSEEGDYLHRLPWFQKQKNPRSKYVALLFQNVLVL